LALLLSMLALLPVLSAQDAKKDAAKDAGKDMEKPAPSPYIKIGSLQGQIAGIDETKRTIRVKIPALNQGEAQALMQAQYQLSMARKPQDVMQAQQRIMQHQARLYSSTQEVQIATVEDVVVRLANPPTEFDDKGQPKRHTREELIKLKGDTKLPGYKGDFSDLQAGQVVQVTLVRHKDEKVVRPKAPMKNKDKDPEPQVMNDNLPHTNFVVVVYEGRPGGR
jgi:hypothetical protein